MQKQVITNDNGAARRAKRMKGFPRLQRLQLRLKQRAVAATVAAACQCRHGSRTPTRSYRRGE
eukprot:gene10987-biopygen4088